MHPWSLLIILGQLSLAAHSARTPVILIPGIGGSVLEEKLNRTSAPEFYCTKEAAWQVAWLSLTAVSRPNCLLDELAMTYNATEKRYHNQTGVEVRAYQFGNLSGVAALDPALPSVSGTYAKLIDGLEDAGYEEGKDLFGAPYDFRLAADGLEQVGFFAAFKLLIEGAVRGNGGQKAALVAHSMGGLVSLYFLASQPQEWRDKHIAVFIAASTPWLGSATALKGSVSGDNFDVSFIPHGLLRPLQSTLPSGPWLFPAAGDWGDEVIVSTKGGDNYTAGDALRLLHDLNLTQQATVYPFVHALTYPLPKLDGLAVRCLHGAAVDTDVAFVYDVDHFNASAEDVPAPSRTRTADGDGTVDKRSLEACSRLSDDVRTQAFQNATHLGMLKDDRAIGVILGILNEHQSGAARLSTLYSRFAGWLGSGRRAAGPPPSRQQLRSE